MLFARLHPINEFADALALAFCFTFFLCCRFTDKDVWLRLLGSRLSDFSYSLYLIHMPLANAIASAVNRPFDVSHARSYLVYAASLLFIIAVAWLFGVLFESRTAAVRDKPRKMLGVKPSSRVGQPS